ncbi:hypothetical protein TeGR_g14830 [Tetraparma gracilis]|uniref:Uncharacterized protein n=1 Tax=Tetraparma gracilis TaxID=2962635 RepID=A0ABQ6M3G0_9STRA|nr:hypothetical protein TeGR_g14830 [Tetraparma gracilis]
MLAEYRSKSHARLQTGTKLSKVEVTDEGTSVLAGSEAEIRAPIHQVMAYFAGYYRRRVEIGVENDDSAIVFKTVDRPDERCWFILGRYEAPFPLTNREVLTCTVWERVDADEFFVAGAYGPNVTHAEHPESPEFVRMRGARVMSVKKISPTLTSVSDVSCTDLGGFVPKSINNAITVPQVTHTLVRMQLLFASIRPTADVTVADAKELGHLLHFHLHLLQADGLRSKIGEMVDDVTVLREAKNEHPWLEVLLVEVMRNRVRVPKGCAKAPAEITEEDARKIGRALANALIANVSGEAAVDEWVMTYPALGELEQKYTFMRPMMGAIAGDILAQVAWGVKFRAYLGAGMSAADALSDAYMINQFYEKGNTGTAKSLLVMVGANIAYQTFVVYVQTQGLKKKKWRTMLFEMLTVITFTKPGIDAYRVASGAEQLAGAAVDPLNEMIITKMGELVFEAIPGLILQLVALLSAKERSTSAVVSIAISTASTALTATTMFWDMDTDPGARHRNPDW